MTAAAIARPRPVTVERTDRLTGREFAVLALLAHGLTNASIARELALSLRTVDTHVTSILGKLDIATTPDHNRRVLAALAYWRDRQDIDTRRHLADVSL